MSSNRKLVATLACRNQGSRLYGKPVQNLDIVSGTRIIDNIIRCLQSIEIIDEVVLAISLGTENEIFKHASFLSINAFYFNRNYCIFKNATSFSVKWRYIPLGRSLFVNPANVTLSNLVTVYPKDSNDLLTILFLPDLFLFPDK